MAGHVIERKRDDGSIIYRINQDALSGVYRINPDSWQHEFVKELKARGFDALPSGLFNDGRGMTAAGGGLLKRLHGKYGNRLRVRIAKDEPSEVWKNPKTVRVTLNHEDLRSINAAYRNIKYERNRELSDALEAFLKSTFPNEFGEADEVFTSYVPGTLARILSGDVVDNLSPKDKQAIQEFIPRFVRGMEFSLRSAKNIKFAKDGLGAARTIYLKKGLLSRICG